MFFLHFDVFSLNNIKLHETTTYLFKFYHLPCVDAVSLHRMQACNTLYHGLWMSRQLNLFDNWKLWACSFHRKKTQVDILKTVKLNQLDLHVEPFIIIYIYIYNINIYIYTYIYIYIYYHYHYRTKRKSTSADQRKLQKD